MSNSKTKQKKNKKKTDLCWPSTFAVRAGADCGVVCVAFVRSCRCGVVRLPFVAAGCGVVAAGRAAVFCAVPCRFSSLRFCITISGRVGSGQPNAYWAKNKKNPLFRLFCYTAMTAMAMAAAISNPPRHFYSVAFFQISAAQFRHCAAMTAI